MTIRNSGDDFFKAEKKNPQFSGRKNKEVVQSNHFVMSSLPPSSIKLIH